MTQGCIMGLDTLDPQDALVKTLLYLTNSKCSYDSTAYFKDKYILLLTK